ncbi:MAG TPA: hypothetical protein VME19_07130 [Streptosporangiaceae bacterium]|nr:hypothetical protein [Streptosporangiaceae bacterium]
MTRAPMQDELLATARKGQEIMADAIRTWFETVRTATPRLSSVYAPFAERRPRLPSVYAPLAGQLPRAEAAVASAYDLAERMLASQRKFAEDVVKATRPLLPGSGVSEPEGRRESAPQETVAAKAPRATATKSTAKTSTAKTSTAKATATTRAPKTTPATRAPKTSTAAAAKRAPKDSSAG